MEGDLVSHLQCDVELQVTDGDQQALNKRAAEALRKAAAMIESGHLEDGVTDVTDGAGKKIGTIYVDYSESDMSILDEPN